ncbi:MAG: spermidine synthase [Burkholderiales bacterium]|nr:spermidine synthase [Burkholderiales bacterium]
MKRDPRRIGLFLLFFVSGFTGLIYESLWSHYLKLFLGHAAYAQTLVLVIFMGGMASGAAIASKISLHLKNLLTGYAIAEIGIGLLALAFHPVFSAVMDLSFTRLMPGLDSPLKVESYKWGIAVLLLLPPSLLLGTTFPLMSGAFLRRFPGRDGSNLATLYFSNSLGAALGVLVASFILIGLLGLPGTLQLAGAINLLIGASALLLARTAETIARVDAEGQGSLRQRLPALFLAAAFVTGLASFIYEVSWIRMLSLVLGSSFHAFELMLSAFITGLALGSLAIRRHIDRVADPVAFAALIQLAMGVLAVLTLPVYAHSFVWMGELVRSLHKDAGGYALFNLGSHGIAFAVMLPATFMAGMTLPLFTHVLIRQGYGERSIGLIYAANTLGAIFGVIFAVHFAFPALGLKLTLVSGALLDIALGLVLLRLVGATTVRWATALAALAVPVLVVRMVPLDDSVLGSGVYRTGAAQLENSTTLYYQDGKTASISVSRIESTVVIRTNGKADAAIEMDPDRPAHNDEITMAMAAAVPLAMRPDARNVANIGFGSGLTTHVALSSPNIVDLSTIEIERAVIDGSHTFRPRVERAYRDPRSNIFIEDAKSWFARHNRSFDIIISEPSNPWVSGVASLFSVEFYARIGHYLDDRGLLVQWLNLYEFNTRLAASVITALNRHFGDYAIYLTDDSNILIVAIRSGSLPPLTRDIFKFGAMARELDRVGIRTLDDLALRRMGNAAMFGPMLAALDAPVNSDYYPYVELNAPQARFLKQAAVEFPRLGIYALPLIEMLDAQGSAWNAEHLTPANSWRYKKVKLAMEIRAALLGEPFRDPAVADQMTSWRERLGKCATNHPDEALSAMHEIALATLAHLDRKNLQALWQHPGWLSCDSPKVTARLALYQATARRDAPAMLAAAQAALADRREGVEWRRYVLEAGLLAARALARDTAADKLWELHGRELYADGRMPPELVLLLSYSTKPK